MVSCRPCRASQLGVTWALVVTRPQLRVDTILYAPAIVPIYIRASVGPSRILPVQQPSVELTVCSDMGR
jgi:hypothetical protein